ncbi:MAG TPA: SLC13 family permease [Iamia sp.]|nr:SLC13 family permease [Iamia sp.]
MADSTIVYLVLGAVVALFVSNRLPVEIVAFATALSLWATGVLDLDQSLAGFGDPTVLFIAALFVVSEALDATGVTAAVGHQLVVRAGASHRRLLVLMMLVGALLTSVISVNGAVAALVPVVVVTAVRVDVPSSQLMMPLAFAAHAGSMLALTGSPVNVLISEAADTTGEGAFGFFDFTLVGVPLLAGTVAIVVLFGDRLLPHRNARAMPPDLSQQAKTLKRHYQLDAGSSEALFDRLSGVAEVVIPPRSGLIGMTAFPGMVTESGDLVVLAVHRNDQPVGPRETTVRAGDALLLQGTWDALEENLADPGVVVVDDPDAVRRQAVPFGRGARRTLAIVAGMVALLVTGAVPPAVAGLLAAGAIVLTRVITVEQAYRGTSWTTLVLVGGMIPLSTAMQSSGAADELAEVLVRIVGDAGAYPLLLALFVMVAVLGQLISNTATALILIPVAVSAAVELGVSARPVLMFVCVISSAALLTPVATPANMMVMGPGGYRFTDYAKLGGPLLAWYFVVGIGLVPLIWRF